ncbi:hypothetical protein FVE85_4905 [Porphyridium purpureum]|uniref:Uncharacterized protein n=1 Tax=Porphyridium purpureum TaxID=35688 RepID=A0A5J4YR64_PORPP|nr:hypothetical protein FVE85_4905 [Porphyridium purpureum]|eukprot:POR1596..scf236_6
MSSRRLSAAQVAELQPITREFLREFYEDFPIDPMGEEVAMLAESAMHRAEQLGLASPPKDVLIDAPPKHMDHNMYMNRWQCDEIVDACAKLESAKEQLDVVKALGTKAAETGAKFKAFQDHQKAHVNRLVSEFLPNDFRVTMLNHQRAKKEARYEKELEDLKASDGSLKEQYGLLWKQQWERRQGLADLGTASGMWKAVVKYIGGVPEVLLDFAGQINAPLGPTEEMRILYGPHLYELTRISNAIHYLLRCVFQIQQQPDTAALCAGALGFAQRAVDVYSEQASKYLDFMTVIVEKSPVFVSSEKLAAVRSKSANAGGTEQPFEQIIVAARMTERVPIDMPPESEPDSADQVSLYYQVSADKDIKFAVQKTNDASWFVVKLKPACARGTHEIGKVALKSDVPLSLVFDNTYSYLTRKVVRYRYCIVNDGDPVPVWVAELQSAGHL